MNNKRIAYQYLFNYFGRESYRNQTITGAAIAINIRPYKDGREILFENNKEPCFDKLFLPDAISVSFHPETQFTITENVIAEHALCEGFGWDYITYQVTGYFFDIPYVMTEEEKAMMPDIVKDLPAVIPIDVPEHDFRAFLKEHVTDFDILDNKKAQVAGVCFFDATD